MTHTMSATSTLPVHPTRSVRGTSGLVLVGNPEGILLKTVAGVACKTFRKGVSREQSANSEALLPVCH